MKPRIPRNYNWAEIEYYMSLLFRDSFYKYRPRVIIHTGTSRDGVVLKTLYKVAKKKKTPIYTVTPWYKDYNDMRLLYQHRNIVKCRYGYSVNIEKATNFLKQDEAILRHEQYPALEYDGNIMWYLQQFRGDTEDHPKVRFYEENMFKHLFPTILKKFPLFVLDSPVGFFELQEMIYGMGKRRYYLFVKDISHFKHFRTYGCIIAHPKTWQIIAESKNEWCLARHKGCDRSANLGSINEDSC
jgi:hypothetical protein